MGKNPKRKGEIRAALVPDRIPSDDPVRDRGLGGGQPRLVVIEKDSGG